MSRSRLRSVRWSGPGRHRQRRDQSPCRYCGRRGSWRSRSSGRNLTVEPHSISIVDPSSLPTTPADVDNCKQCDQVLGLHAPTLGPEGPQPPFVAALDNSRSSAAQLAQLKSLGDSVLVPQQGNTYLTYFCAVHPWMQGTIEVR